MHGIPVVAFFLNIPSVSPGREAALILRSVYTGMFAAISSATNLVIMNLSFITDSISYLVSYQPCIFDRVQIAQSRSIARPASFARKYFDKSFCPNVSILIRLLLLSKARLIARRVNDWRFDSPRVVYTGDLKSQQKSPV